MGKDIAVFKRKLTNLSSANPLLWMGRLRAGIHLDLAEILFESGRSSEDFLNDLCSGKKRMKLSAVFDPRNPSENRAGIHLQKLARARLTENQERGTDNLFMAWPFILGQWPDASWLRTPFQFIPLNLVRDDHFWWIEPALSSAILNPALMLAYAHHTGKNLETELYEKELSIEADNALEYLTRLYELLKESRLDINFNSELFSLKTTSFSPIRKGDLPSGFGPGILKLQPQLVMGIFSLSDSLLLPDFDWLEKQGTDLESLFLKEDPEGNPVFEKDLLFPLPADGSQEECLRHLLTGKSLMVQGPPGTGKSQLIVNLIAASAASGKSVLVVCQKKVALQVVYDRLEQLGIGRHAALWADFRNDLGKLYEQIARHIAELEETESRNKGLDTIILEREYLRHCQEISRISEQLESWKTALFDESMAGISFFALQQRLAGKTPDVDFQYLTDFQYADWEEFLRWTDRNGDVLFAGRPGDSVLAFRGIWQPERSSEILNQIHSIADAEFALREYLSHFGWQDTVLPHGLLQKSLDVTGEIPLPSEGYTEDFLSASFRDNLQTRASRLEELLKFLSGWPAGLPANAELLQNLVVLSRNKKGKNAAMLSILSLMDRQWKPYLHYFRLLRKAAYQNPDDVLEKAAGFFSLCSEQFIFSALSFLPEDRAVTQEKLSGIPGLVRKLADLDAFYQEVRKVLPMVKLRTMAELALLLTELQQLAAGRKKSIDLLGIYFPGQEAEAILSRLQEERNLLPGLRTRIVESDRLMALIPRHWQKALEFMTANSETVNISDMNDAWAFAWLREMMRAYPVLSHNKVFFEKEIEALQVSLQKKRLLAGDFLRLKLEEETHRDVVRNRLNNRVSYRGLHHQVSKKRQRLPLRKVWEMHGEEILKFIPCWLATPESVSATWSMDMQFDLVIFDEASQCFAEKGIPSIARGRQVVIIGDDKQLPPNHLFSSRWEENSDDSDEIIYSQQDSLLDLGRQFYPSRMLRWHYRSVFPELISFSNRHFYEDKLHVFPSPETLKPRRPALNFVKVEGLWQNQCNPEEAYRIAESAVRFFRENSSDTLGVISFNIRQQEKIEEAVADLCLRESVIIPDWFFVKNIENVQGDERDYIWFSVAYARNESGRMISQFGSLGTEGGENRLNVAISRARKGIRVFSSLLPSEWNIGINSARGPELLAAYLRYVYEAADQGLIAAAQAEGSLLRLADKLKYDGDEVSILFRRQSRLFAMDSMKAHFGLMPLHLKDLGYKPGFEYWEDGNFS